MSDFGRDRHVIRRRARLLPAARWGVAIAAIISMLCVATIPYTFGRVSHADAAGARNAPSRRFERMFEGEELLPPFWAPHAHDEAARLAALETERGSRVRHLLGTDRLGRDLFIRSLAGGAISLGIGLAAAAVAVVIGTGYGTIAASCGGRIDALMMRIVDILYGLPNVLIVVLLAVAADGLSDRFQADLTPGARQVINVATLLLAIGGTTWLTMARVIRGQVLSLKRQAFMEACRAIGVGWRRQFSRHLLPNLLGPILVYATLAVPTAILAESFLSFLGIGVREPLPSWGNLAADGLIELNIVRVRWWLLFWPCAFIAVTLVALNLIGEGLREAVDPKGAHRP